MRRFKPSVNSLETRNLLSVASYSASEGYATWTDSGTGHNMAEYTILATEVENRATSGGRSTDQVRTVFQDKVIDLTANTSVSNVKIANYTWVFDDTTGNNLFAEGLFYDETITYSPTTIHTLYSTSVPFPVLPASLASLDTTPATPSVIPSSTTLLLDPGDPPVSDPIIPVGPSGPALQHNQDIYGYLYDPYTYFFTSPSTPEATYCDTTVSR